MRGLADVSPMQLGGIVMTRGARSSILAAALIGCRPREPIAAADILVQGSNRARVARASTISAFVTSPLAMGEL
ncbi:hypothetical protein IVA78_20850 [Bradyrhizobium sp. 137]|uniref:hypothetical protein n=1 Tax=Bradyrhizobium sp. 137 TaxID=2782614 RepID=UPI001FFBA798|nr:hypothetical protein [Bradyrhizobium sp. 137]MCK1757602.1 hypothetical protein [Bradyrhizobium sp. 137]